MIAYGLRVAHPAYFAEMRLGKTLVAIRTALLRGLRRVLVVCPLSAVDGWARELDAEIQSYALAIGTRARRIAEIDRARRFTVTNYESHSVIGDVLAKTQWDCVILDESPCIKNPKAKRSRFYVRNFRRARCRMILSGMPAPESPLEYFQQLRFLNSQILGYVDYYKWRARWFDKLPGESDWCLSVEGAEVLTRNLANACYFLARKDAGLDRERIREVRTCELPPKARAAYDELERSYAFDLDGVEYSTIWDAPKFTWLRRIAGGVFDGRVVHDRKLQLLLELVNGELRGEQLIVWAWFVDEIEFAARELRRRGVTCEAIRGSMSMDARRAAEQSFRTGSARVLIAQPAATKYGSDFSAADVIVYWSTPIGLDDRAQSEDRNLSVDESGSLLIVDLIVKDTVDEPLYWGLCGKRSKQDRARAMIDRIKRRWG